MIYDLSTIEEKQDDQGEVKVVEFPLSRNIKYYGLILSLAPAAALALRTYEATTKDHGKELNDCGELNCTWNFPSWEFVAAMLPPGYYGLVM